MADIKSPNFKWGNNIDSNYGRVMIIVSTQNSYDWSQAQVYRLAGKHVLFQTACPSLKSFHVDEAPVELVVEASMAVQECLDLIVDSNDMQEVYRGPAPFGDRVREVSYRRLENFARIELDDELVCEIDFSNDHIHLIREGGFANSINVELVTGPAMMVLLASLKTYCLHASAVSTRHGVIAITGESGAGKSTLAWQAGEGWQQLADDISPIIYEKGGVGIQLSSDFPQLKLDGASAPGLSLGDAKIDLLLRLNPKAAEVVTFRKLSKSEAMLQFVRHTVAVRLFDEKVMRRHTKFATYFANKIPVVELSYPRDLMQLTELREQIVDYLDQLE